MNADVTVEELMDREYVGVSRSDGLLETVELLLREEADTAVVQQGSEHVGVLTERDVMATLVDGPPLDEATVDDAMTDTVPSIEPQMTLDQAADEMSTRSARRLVVTNGTEPLGVLSEGDLLDSRTYQSHPGTADVSEPVSEGERVATLEVSGGRTVTETQSQTESTEGFEDQSICEGCGRLSSDLSGFNGQILCPDCRDM